MTVVEDALRAHRDRARRLAGRLRHRGGPRSARETGDLASAFRLPPTSPRWRSCTRRCTARARPTCTTPMRRPICPGSATADTTTGRSVMCTCGNASRTFRASTIRQPAGRTHETGREGRPAGGSLQAGAKVDFRSFAPVRFEILDVKCAGWRRHPLGADRACRARVGRGAPRGRVGDKAEWIVRVVLTGPTPLARELGDEDERRALADELAEALGALDVDVWTHGTRLAAQSGRSPRAAGRARRGAPAAGRSAQRQDRPCRRGARTARRTGSQGPTRPNTWPSCWRAPTVSCSIACSTER